MNEWYFLFFVASWVAVFSIPIVLFAVLMRVVGRIGSRTLVLVLAVDLIFWVMAAFFWWTQSRHEIDIASERVQARAADPPSQIV